ncbi:MAG: hypothetical protein V1859_05835 [archaeon]
MAGTVSKVKINPYLVLSFLILTLMFYLILQKPEITGKVIKTTSFEDYNSNLIINLTFDDYSTQLRDYSSINHTFTATGSVVWTNSTLCKWYGCLNLSATSGDYISATTKYNLTSGGMAISYWVYFVNQPGDANPQGIYEIGGNSNLKRMQYSTYCFNPGWSAKDGEVSTNTYSEGCVDTGSWYFIFEEYDNATGRYNLWFNGNTYHLNSSQNKGSLNYSFGESAIIGKWGAADLEGYLDEFVLWNRGNFTEEEVLMLYNEKREGTPPTKDIYIKAIKYNLSQEYMWATTTNEINTTGTMPITITIANAGTTATGTFAYNMTISNVQVCSNVISLNALSETTIVCNWTKSLGFHIGNLTVDTYGAVTEDIEINNVNSIYIPFLNHPWINNLSNWTTVYLPYFTNSSNIIANRAYNVIKGLDMDDFNPSWTGNDVDPRGKKGRENALACMLSNYTSTTNSQCARARNHLFGWANIDVTTYSYIQSIHELSNVGFTLDYMFANLTQAEFDNVTVAYYNICQHISNLVDIQNDGDASQLLDEGGNGWGFGSGMGMFCYSMIGQYADNPTLIQETDQQYWGENIPDMWMDREKAYLNAYKNDSYAQYQEGWLYKTYSQYHLLENLVFEKTYGLYDVSKYNNAFDSIGREFLYALTDKNYNGNTLRGDESNLFRVISRGDTNSYQHIADQSYVMWDIILLSGLAANDISVKENSLWLREYAYNLSEGYYPELALFLDKQLSMQVGGIKKSPEQTMPRFMYDNANDIFFLRNNYSYVNDTILQIDGGEERGSGHSQAQGYYLYILGEPFIDMEQVPYEDDVRSEQWKNGISLQNTTLLTEGTVGYYSQACGNAPQNQYYGMLDCEISGSYPNYRQFPLAYGGDIEDYMGTSDANFAGAYVYRPYKNSNPVREYFIKFGDTVAKRTTVTAVTQGNRIYHNFIGIANEFTSAASGLNWTLNRTNAATKQNIFLNTQLLYSDSNIYFGGGTTGVSYCFAKTSCTHSDNRLYRRNYYYTDLADTSLDLIFSHHWNVNSNEGVVSINSTEKGLVDGSNYILFDGNSDDAITYSNKNASGWGLAYNDVTDEIAAFNTTHIEVGAIDLFESNRRVSVHLKRTDDYIKLTVNTMERDPYIDLPKTATVTIDASELSIPSNFVITKDDGSDITVISESGTKVTFEVTSGQNSNYYMITGSGVDLNNPEVNFSASHITNQSARLSVTTNEAANVTVNWGESISELINNMINSTYTTLRTFFFQGLAANSTIFYNLTTCDRFNNCVNNATLNFTILENEPLDLTPPFVTDIENNSITDTAVTIEITLNESSNATVFISTNSDLSDYSYVNSSTRSLSHEITITGLASLTQYYWQVNGSDIYENYYSTSVYSFATNPADLTAPSILAISNSTITTVSFIVSLTLNESANATFFVYNESNLANPDIITHTTRSLTHEFNPVDLINNTVYFWKVNGSDSFGNLFSSQAYNLTTSQTETGFPNASKFDGATTSFQNETNMSDVNLMTLEIASYGKILWAGSINASDLNLDRDVNITAATVSVDSISASRLNRSATIYLYSLSFTNPRVKVDGIACSDCVELSYSSGNLSFNVTHFTIYTVDETPVTPPDDDEEEDAPRGGGGSRGGGGGGSYVSASPIKANITNVNTEKPSIIRQPKNETPNIISNYLDDIELKEKQLLLEQPKAVLEKKQRESSIAFVITVMFIMIATSSVFAYKRKLQGLPFGSSKTQSPKERHIITRSARTPLELPNSTEAKNLYELAQNLHKMSDSEFNVLSNSSMVESWVADSLEYPVMARILGNSDSKEEMYRVLYNMYVKAYEPQKTPVLRVNEKILNIDFNSIVKTPFTLMNCLPIHSLNALFITLPYLSDAEFNNHFNNCSIQEWASQYGSEIKSVIAAANTKDELYSSLKMIRREQEMYKLLKE